MTTLKFTPSHEWIRNEKANEYTLGITDHAQSLLGDLVYVELPEPGKNLHAGDNLAVVESVKTAADVYAPVSGTVTQINQTLQNDPSLVNSDPYKAGWLVKLSIDSPAELDTLLTEEAYQASLTD